MPSNLSLYMLDTDTCSYLIRGSSTRLEDRVKSLSPEQLCISVVTRAELRYGVERKPEAKRLAGLVNSLLAAVRVLPLEPGAADWYARIRAQLDADGAPIGLADTLIAAHAIDSGAILVTNNAKHYERIRAQPFRYENWSEEPAIKKKGGKARKPMPGRPPLP